MRFRCDVRLDRRRTDQHRASGMVLHPLAQVGVRVLVPVLIRFCKHVVDLEHGREGRQHDKDERHNQGNCGKNTRSSDCGGRTWDHRRRAYSKTLFRCQSCHRTLKFWLLLLNLNSIMLRSARQLAVPKETRADRHPHASGRCPF